MGLLKTLAEAIVGDKAAAAANDIRNTWRVSRSPDRAVLRQTLLPAFAPQEGRVLWIGCRRYTASYPDRLAQGGAEVWTTDIDPDVARWGAKNRHRTGDVCKIDRLFGDMTFDAVLCNGVLGYGVDRPADQRAALDAIAIVLRPGGRLLLGWNTDKIADPLASGVMPPAYVHEGFSGVPERILCPPTTHIYDLLRRQS